LGGSEEASTRFFVRMTWSARRWQTVT